MALTEVVDEATLQCTPEEYWAAITDELSGRSHWWLPFASVTRRGPDTGSVAGSAFDVAVNARGQVERRVGTVRFGWECSAFEQPSRSVMEYVDGPLRGTLETTVEPVGTEKTKVTAHLRARPHGTTGQLLSLVGFAGPHSKVTRAQFPRIEGYVRDKRSREAAGS
jgi:hypothetical protein